MPSAEPHQYQVVFSPSGKRGRFPEGTTVLQAAQRLGADLDSVCGGRSLCGRCRIEVTEGELPRLNLTSRAESLSKMTAGERAFLERLDGSSHCRLACRARILADVAIEIPATSQVHRQVVRKPCEAHDIELRPVVRPHYVEVEPPRPGDPRGDLERLCEALQREWGIRVRGWDLEVTRVLQQTLRQGHWKVTAAIRHDHQLIAVWPGLKDKLYGVAVDVGSTTLAAHLCDLGSGTILAEAGWMNPQIRYGEDLMSRVSYVMKNADGLQELTNVVRTAINELVVELARQAGCQPADVVEITIVGNSVMQHVVLGWDPTELGRAPFTLVSNQAVDLPARDIGIAIHPGGYAYALPCIAGHVGADMAGVLLAEAPWEREEISLIVDIGTNAELALGNRDRLLVASSPTGPAFEGAHISAGQRAAPGAIESVRIDPVTLEPSYRVIDCDYWSDEAGFDRGLPAGGITGICGSGIIEAIAELYRVGVIGSDGRIRGDQAARSPRIIRRGSTFAYVLVPGVPGIEIQQGDVRAIQLAKAALYAGARLLMEKLGIDRVDRIRLAGAFGARIDVKYAMLLGMIPDCSLAGVSSAGNAAGTGARIALLDREARDLIARRARAVEKVETAVDKRFQELFVAALPIPHATDPFHELRQIVDLPAPTGRRDRPGGPA